LRSEGSNLRRTGCRCLPPFGVASEFSTERLPLRARRVWGLCPALLRTILAAAETGAPLKSCCAVAGISYETLRGWILEEPEIGEKLARARERARAAALRVLQEAWN
jgi:hypothetical protein